MFKKLFKSFYSFEIKFKLQVKKFLHVKNTLIANKKICSLGNFQSTGRLATFILLFSLTENAPGDSFHF